jgi:hypothetical protein
MCVFATNTHTCVIFLAAGADASSSVRVRPPRDPHIVDVVHQKDAICDTPTERLNDTNMNNISPESAAILIATTEAAATKRRTAKANRID